MAAVDTLLAAIDNDLGAPDGWEAPVEFPESLALCALNSVFSLRAQSTSGARVLARYRALRPTADTDSGLDLLEAMDAAGGPEAFAHNVLDNRSKLPGTDRLKSIGVYDGLTRLSGLDMPVTTTARLRETAADRAPKKAWLSTRGLGPLSWSYLIMNAGVDNEIKPDVMIKRYLTRVLGRDQEPTDVHARELLRVAGAELNVTSRQLDRAIWLYERSSAR